MKVQRHYQRLKTNEFETEDIWEIFKYLQQALETGDAKRVKYIIEITKDRRFRNV